MLNLSTVPARPRICVLLGGGPRQATARAAPSIAALLRPALRQPA